MGMNEVGKRLRGFARGDFAMSDPALTWTRPRFQGVEQRVGAVQKLKLMGRRVSLDVSDGASWRFHGIGELLGLSRGR